VVLNLEVCWVFIFLMFFRFLTFLATIPAGQLDLINCLVQKNVRILNFRETSLTGLTRGNFSFGFSNN